MIDAGLLKVTRVKFEDNYFNSKMDNTLVSSTLKLNLANLNSLTVGTLC